MKITKITFSLENHPRPSLRNLMRSYQAARKVAKTGEAGIEIKRLNKALGLAMRKNYDREYVTSTQACNCPDKRGYICKHRLALMLVGRAIHLDGQNA